MALRLPPRAAWTPDWTEFNPGLDQARPDGGSGQAGQLSNRIERPAAEIPFNQAARGGDGLAGFCLREHHCAATRMQADATR